MRISIATSTKSHSSTTPYKKAFTIRTSSPPEIHQLEQQGHRFFPLELASLVHAESARIVASPLTHAIREGIDVVVDGVGANENSVRTRLAALQEAGYTVELINVECPRETSERGIFQ